MRTRGETFRIDCWDIGTESPGGALLIHTDLHPTCWIPISQVHEIHRDPKEPYIICSLWIAKQKGFI